MKHSHQQLHNQQQPKNAAKRPRTSETKTSMSSLSSPGFASMNESHLLDADKYKTDFKSGTPFPHLFVTNLLTEGVLEQVRDELLLPSTNWNQKKNDLYDFYQSDSLTSADSSLPATRGLVKLLYSQNFRGWIETITGISTTDMIDVSAAKYLRGSHLLCHDDNLSTRRIAYILYLTPESWTEEDGGCLDLFQTDPSSDSIPSRMIGKSLTPVFNSIAFFEVSERSFHQVAEVLSDAKGPRLSISGWFHGKSPLPPPKMPIIKSPAFHKCDASYFRNGAVKDDLSLTRHSFFNPLYTKENILSQMRKSFTRDASLQIDGFLLPGLAKSFRAQFSSERMDWEYVGPINQQSYRTYTINEKEKALSLTAVHYPKTFSFQAFVREHLLTHEFFQLISNSTGLRFDSVSYEVRCFTHGDYTMLTDPHYKASTKKKKAEAVSKRAGEAMGTKEYLVVNPADDDEDDDKNEDLEATSTFVEVNLCLATPSSADETSEWPEEAGGYVSYMTEDDQLLCVPPKENSLSLVLKEPGVMSFVKFVSQDAPGPRFDINFLFRVKED